jgi:hypothetical protein
MSPAIYQAGTRVVTPQAVYDHADETAAARTFRRFLRANDTQDATVAAMRRYNAHLETLLDGANFRSLDADAVRAIDPRVLEVPKDHDTE